MTNALTNAQNAIKSETDKLNQVGKLSAYLVVDGNHLPDAVNRLDAAIHGNLQKHEFASEKVSDLLKADSKKIIMNAGECLTQFNVLSQPHGVQKLGKEIAPRARNIRAAAVMIISSMMDFQKKFAKTTHGKLGSEFQISINHILGYAQRILINAKKLEKLASTL